MKHQIIKSLDTWARYVRLNKNWKTEHTKFINAQFEKHDKVLSKLSKEKIIELYGIKNLEGYTELLK
jgi:hypothetical protein